MYSLSSFKTYDIRGVWQTEVDEKFGEIMGYSLGKHLLAKWGTNPRILVSSDVREANIPLITHFLRGMKTAGIGSVTVIGKTNEHPQYEYGVCSTPMAYYATIGEYDCACLFTASHNPAEYVGMKIVEGQCLSIKSEELRKMFEAEENTLPEIGESLPEIHEYEGDRVHELLMGILDKFRTLKHVPKFTIDYSHGAATHFEHAFLHEVLSPEITHIFTSPDGRFPAHDTDTSRFANYKPLIEEIQKNGSEFGFIFDGDADRFGMVLPDGIVVTGDILLAIVAKELLTDGTAEKLGSKVIFQEVFCGRIVKQTVEKYSGELRMTRVGRESFVREVIEANGLLAGEVSTHLLFKEYGTIEMPLAGLYYLLKALEKYENASAMVAEFSGYTGGQVFQFITEKKDEAIEALKTQYSQYEQITIDGIRIETPDWWFCVRKSGTEPMLKVALGAKDQETYDHTIGELRAFFTEFGATEKM